MRWSTLLASLHASWGGGAALLIRVALEGSLRLLGLYE